MLNVKLFINSPWRCFFTLIIHEYLMFYREILCVFQHAAVGQTGGGACDPAERAGGSSSHIGKLLRLGQDRSAHRWRGVGCPTSTYCISWLLCFTERINDVLIELCNYYVWTLASSNSSLNVSESWMRDKSAVVGQFSVLRAPDTTNNSII